MSKRRNRGKSPNLPAETLARARQQAGLEPTGEPEIDAPPEAPPAEQKIEASALPSPAPGIQSEARRGRRRAARRRGELPMAELAARGKDKPLDSAAVAELLANPTRVVTEEELRAQYSYVLADLRSMGLLAAGLIVVLIILARVL